MGRAKARRAVIYEPAVSYTSARLGLDCYGREVWVLEMNKAFWKQKLSKLLVEDGGEPEVYGVKGEVSFWCEGGLKVTGNQKTLSVNFRDPDMLVLITMKGSTLRIYRIPYARLVSFELIHKAMTTRRRQRRGSVFFREI